MVTLQRHLQYTVPAENLPCTNPEPASQPPQNSLVSKFEPTLAIENGGFQNQGPLIQTQNGRALIKLIITRTPTKRTPSL